ncbi:MULTISPECIES: methylated-DNA--[protein]-cysteine S-methyltransferase [Bradyrhizobium]|uniref:methylated-DNA--[protein]-cysteine S-methyltransferase n=1 Tax=Bradyrhizobium TaxID=374 RepID=UPI0032DFDE2B
MTIALPAPAIGRETITADARITSTAGPRETLNFATGATSLGTFLVARSNNGICAILFGGSRGELMCDLHERFPGAELVANEDDLQTLVADVAEFIEAPTTGLRLPLDIRGTSFQKKVWQALRDIPVGTTASYADIARRIGTPKAVRAVAQACAANTIAVAIPCHRVIKNDGALSGYRWGVDRKQALLDKEARQ